MKVKYFQLVGYYASKSINAYVINFNYKHKGDNKINVNYNYNITANLVGTVISNQNEEKEIWNRNYILLENDNKLNNIDEFIINEEINIDYKYYNELARSYEREYGITINSVLKLRLNISYSISSLNWGTDNNHEIDDYIELDIPITNTVTEVKKNYERNTTNDILIDNENIDVTQIILYIIGGALIITATTIIIIRIVKNKTIYKNLYERNMKRIMKYYRDLIVTVNNEPKIENLKIMNIELLEDLIDVAEQNKSNIIHYEVINNKKSNLYVIVNDYVYIYVVTDNKLK